MKRVLLRTFGCKTNQYETEALAGRLAAMGARVVLDGGAFDFVVVNTCTVTERADRKCRQFIRKVAREHPRARVYVTGCYVTRKPDEVTSLPGVAAVEDDKEKLPALIARDEQLTRRVGDAETGTRPMHRSRALLKIQDGCDAFCSYCIVPHVRPTLRSKPIECAAEEARRLVDAGFREIVLTGIHLGRYGADRTDGARLTDVVRRLAATPGLARLRLSSIEMPEVPDELIELIAQNPVICPHLHLPLQSGDASVLGAMNRRYTPEDFLDVVRRIRRRIRDVSITTDVIAGFPGESDAAFENTLRICREAAFSRMHVFPYSVRPGTRAATLPGRLPARVVTRRKRQLIRLGKELALRYKQQFVGKSVRVLVEDRQVEDGRSWLVGLTEHYMRVRFEGDDEPKGRMLDVTVDSTTPEVMTGRGRT